jgi:O-antigen/teichoic acid export membrane protein
LATSLLTIVSNIGLSFLRSQEKSAKYTLTTLSRFFLILGLNTYFVLVLKWNLFGILIGNLTAQAVVLLLLIPTITRTINFSYSKSLLKKLLTFGIAVIPAGLAMWVMDLADRYLLNYFSGPAEVGIYALAYKFGYVISVTLVAPFQLAWPTVSFSLASKKESKKIYGAVLTYFLLISSFLALVLTFFSPDLIPIISTPEYLKAAPIVVLIAFSYIFLGLHFIIVIGLHLKDKSKYYPILVVIPGLLNLILNYLLIPRYGIIGAGITTFFSFLIMLILTVLLVKKYYRFEYQILRIIKIIIAVVLSLSLYYLFGEKYGLWFPFLILFVFGVVLVVTGFFDKREINYLRSRLKF